MLHRNLTQQQLHAYQAFVNPVATVQASNTYDNTILAEPTLANYWPLNETSGTVAYDIKGAVNGTYTGTYVQNVPIGQLTGVKLDGSTSYVTAAPSMTATGNQSWEFIASIYSTAAATSAINIASAASYLSGVGYDPSSAAHGMYAYLNGGASFSYSALAQPAALPMHFVLTYDGTNARLYINNVLAVTTAVATLGASPVQLVMGALRSGSSTYIQFLDGVLTRVAYYTSTLTQAKISAHYQAFLASPVVTPLNGFTYQDYDTFVTGGLGVNAQPWYHFPMNEPAGSSTFTDLISGFTGSYVSGASPGGVPLTFDGKTSCQCSAIAAGTLPTATLSGGPTTNWSFVQWVMVGYNPVNNSTGAYALYAVQANNTTLANSSIASGQYGVGLEVIWRTTLQTVLLNMALPRAILHLFIFP